MTDTMTLSRDTATPIAPRQPERDLPSTLTAPVLPSAPKPRRDKGAKGLPPSAFAIAAAVIVALLWGAWVTKSIMAPPEAVPMASVHVEPELLLGAQLQPAELGPDRNVVLAGSGSLTTTLAAASGPSFVRLIV